MKTIISALSNFVFWTICRFAVMCVSGGTIRRVPNGYQEKKNTPANPATKRKCPGWLAGASMVPTYLTMFLCSCVLRFVIILLKVQVIQKVTDVNVMK